MIQLEAPPQSNELVLRDVLHNELGTIKIYNNLIIMEANSDVTVSIKTGIFVLMKVVKLVGTRPMVYISNRVNSYSVDPNDYKFLNLIPNLKGIGIVCYNDLSAVTAGLETNFINKPAGIFRNMDDAKCWARELLSSSLN